MGTIIIKNLSTVKDTLAVSMVYDIIAGADDNILMDNADALGVDVGIRTDEEQDAKVITITDRD